MKTKIITILILCCIAEIAEATIVDITVATDKESYLIGEEVIVSVIAYNPNPEPVTLGFVTSLQASYLMDDVFNWSEYRQFNPIPTGRVIQSYDSYTWTISHDSHAMTIYPLDVDIHTVVGEVVGYGQSAPLHFEVIPEPASILLLAIGMLFANSKKSV